MVQKNEVIARTVTRARSQDTCFGKTKVAKARTLGSGSLGPDTRVSTEAESDLHVQTPHLSGGDNDAYLSGPVWNLDIIRQFVYILK